MTQYYYYITYFLQPIVNYLTQFVQGWGIYCMFFVLFFFGYYLYWNRRKLKDVSIECLEFANGGAILLQFIVGIFWQTALQPNLIVFAISVILAWDGYKRLSKTFISEQAMDALEIPEDKDIADKIISYVNFLHRIPKLNKTHEARVTKRITELHAELKNKCRRDKDRYDKDIQYINGLITTPPLNWEVAAEAGIPGVAKVGLKTSNRPKP